MGMDLAAQQMNNTGTAGVIARPPLLFLAALLLGFVLDHLLSLPLPVPRTDFHRITAGFMILIGVVVFVAGICNFSSAATPVQGTEPTRTLVTTGIHGWSRNPIYVGMFLVYAGIGIAVRSPWILTRTLPLGMDPGQAGKSQAQHLVRALSGFTEMLNPHMRSQGLFELYRREHEQRDAPTESGDKLTRFDPALVALNIIWLKSTVSRIPGVW